MKVVILGGTSDIGRALGTHAARRGHEAILTTRGSGEAESIPGLSWVSECDLLDLDAVQRLRLTVAEVFREPFSIIHSVGDFWHHRPLDETGLGVARGHIESHYLTLYHVLHALLPLMVERGSGRIVAFSCNSVGYSYPEMAPFTAAKAAVESLVRCVANEYSIHGIQANALALPTIATAKVQEAKELAQQGSYISPEELAALVLDDALTLSPYVNGNTIKIFRPNQAFFATSYFDRNPSGRLVALPTVPPR